MKFDITGRHIEITPAIRQHVESQFAKIDGTFEGKPATAHLIIEVERGRHRSEVVVNWMNDVLTATSVDSDMYNSISHTVDKIEKQARKLKDKIIDRSHKAIKVGMIAQDPDSQTSIGTETDNGSN
jgi:putative sigma-54 modulation protein